MDRKLEQILRLYGEPVPGDSLSPEDAALRRERERLDGVKRALDARPRIAAPEHVVRQVLQFSDVDRQPEARRDRRPVAHRARRSRPLFAGAGSTLVLLIIAGILFFSGPFGEQADADLISAQREEARGHENEPVIPGESAFDAGAVLADAAPEAPQRRRETSSAAVRDAAPRVQSRSVERLPSSGEPRILTVSSEVQEAGLGWDDARDVHRLHMMIDVVQDRADEIDWEEPAVPLDLLPSPRERSRGGFHQVAQPVPHR